MTMTVASASRVIVTATMAVLLATAVGSRHVIAQATTQPPRFEVASVKVNKSGERLMQLSMPPGRLIAVNVPLRQLIQFSYRLQDYQMVGGPDWQMTERFDINAKAETDASPETVSLMLQTLLADRFKLVIHREVRNMPIYALVIARDDKRLGPKLTASTVDCDAVRSARTPAAQQPRTADGRPLCGMNITRGRTWSGGAPVSILLLWLSQTVQRTVIDRTGLDGNFDVDLTFAPEQAPRPPGDTQPAGDSNGPSLFTALQEQLGLKLEAGTGPVDVLVIDSVQKPTED